MMYLAAKPTWSKTCSAFKSGVERFQMHSRGAAIAATGASSSRSAMAQRDIAATCARSSTLQRLSVHAVHQAQRGADPRVGQAASQPYRAPPGSGKAWTRAMHAKPSVTRRVPAPGPRRAGFVARESQHLAGRREQVMLATKFHAPMGKGPNDAGRSRLHLKRALEASLRHLKTDRIDLYQIHNVDTLTPMEETLRALDGVVRAGKIRYIGCSNLSSWQTAKALGLSRLHRCRRMCRRPAIRWRCATSSERSCRRRRRSSSG